MQILQTDPLLRDYIENSERYRIQIIFTQIERKPSNRPRLINSSFHQDEHYYYPASLVKLPIALFALERLKELGLSKENQFKIVPANQCSQYPADSCNSVQECIEQIFIYSNNDAYNRLFEFLGQDRINNRLRTLGYQGRIHRRFKPGCGGDLGDTTGAVTFFDQAGNIRHQQASRTARHVATPPRGDMRVGRKTRTALGTLNEPMDFSDKNYLPLGDLHQMLIALVEPWVAAEQHRFSISEKDRAFLLKTMAMRPRDAGGSQPDSFRKYLLVGGLERMPHDLQIMNKVGLSYGFVSDVAYIRDMSQGVDFFLSASIYTNKNQIMNDGQYEYETIAYPFMRALGQAVLRYMRDSARDTSVDH
ncbi:serine hydrolase [Thiorhodovibrio winogradskyi]|nr:serine hydrolase [Thiorhodovibrio winogradskyi]